ncbi:hypothetical protein [Clostridium tyrobutyricum]|uniref:hypothetical protein n=1 Tax=Clostridium tyrobutyricum TaxID=1519 RepID=UPI000364963F|nr:hypothetical protein [Clostridium tyrobutyricum]MBV4427709.1 hypothetical protein [Clostridium tyrobutyricum]
MHHILPQEVPSIVQNLRVETLNQEVFQNLNRNIKATIVLLAAAEILSQEVFQILQNLIQNPIIKKLVILHQLKIIIMEIIEDHFSLSPFQFHGGIITIQPVVMDNLVFYQGFSGVLLNL